VRCARATWVITFAKTGPMAGECCLPPPDAVRKLRDAPASGEFDRIDQTKTT